MKAGTLLRALLAGLVFACLAVTIGAPAANADDPITVPDSSIGAVVLGADSDGNPVYAGGSDADPTEPAAGLPATSPYPERDETSTKVNSSQRCEEGSSTTVSNVPNDLKVDWADSVINGGSTKATYTVTAEKSTTFTWNVNVNVSSEVKVAIFGKVTAEINGGIQHTSTTTYGSSVTIEVPPHKTVKADRGMWQEKFAFKYYSISATCVETRSSGTGQAPYRQAWKIS
jgi:hypothetical protein